MLLSFPARRSGGRGAQGTRLYQPGICKKVPPSFEKIQTVFDFFLIFPRDSFTGLLFRNLQPNCAPICAAYPIFSPASDHYANEECS